MNESLKAAASEALTIARLAYDDQGREALMSSSALACIDDAAAQFNAGAFVPAIKWAARSLQYSVGVFDPDYAKVRKIVHSAGIVSGEFA